MTAMTTRGHATESATDTARALTRLNRRTPVQIDTVLAALDAERHDLIGRRARVMNAVHRAAGDTEQRVGPVGRRREVWGMTDADAVTTLAAKVAEGTAPTGYYLNGPDTYAKYQELTVAIAANESEFERLNNEWDRRRWSRFIIVEHVHSGYYCVGGTLDRGKYRSERHWLPEYSGMSESEAIAKLAENAHILCTHCFPNAPVPATKSDPTMCTNKSYDPDKPSRKWFASGNWATCSECGAQATLLQSGVLRKHRRPTAE